MKIMRKALNCQSSKKLKELNDFACFLLQLNIPPKQPPLYNGHLFLSRLTVHTLTLIKTSISTMATSPQRQKPVKHVPNNFLFNIRIIEL